MIEIPLDQIILNGNGDAAKANRYVKEGIAYSFKALPWRECSRGDTLCFRGAHFCFELYAPRVCNTGTVTATVKERGGINA
jgi:hypothetical protein